MKNRGTCIGLRRRRRRSFMSTTIGWLVEFAVDGRWIFSILCNNMPGAAGLVSSPCDVVVQWESSKKGEVSETDMMEPGIQRVCFLTDKTPSVLL